MDTLTKYTDADKVAKILPYLQKKIRTPPDQNHPWCAVFDVDDTLIINHPHKDEKCKVNPVVFPIVQFLHGENVPLYIITARHRTEKSLSFLKKQLDACGYDVENDFETPLYMVTQEYGDRLSPGIFKYKARRQLAQKHSILLSAGDSWTDLTVVLDEEDRGLLRSNPRVRIDGWEDALSEEHVEALAGDDDTVLFTHPDKFQHGLSALYLKLPRRP